MELISGQSVSNYYTSFGWVPGVNGVDPDQIRSDIEAGSSVAAATKDHNVDVTVSTHENGKLVERQETIIGNHAYMIAGVDSDGSILVRNPRGVGNDADKGDILHLSQEEFHRAFNEVTSSAAP